MPKDGTWNMANRKFIEAKDMASWGVLNITRVNDREIETFALQLHKAATGMGKLFGRFFLLHIS